MGALHLAGMLWEEECHKAQSFVHSSEVNLYADDTTLYHSSKCLTDLKRSVETDVESVSKWINENGLLMNSSKTQEYVSK